MSFIDKIIGGGLGGIVEKVTGLVDNVVTSDEERGEIKVKLKSISADIQKSMLDSMKAELSTKERILVTELTQGDKFTKRARPSVVYFGLVLIFINYCLIPAIQVFSGQAIQPLPLPEYFWIAWGGIVATWSVGRSMEKRGGQNKATSIITGSPLVSGFLTGE